MNEKNIKALGEYAFYEDNFDDYYDDVVTRDEINQSIHAFMLEAIFAEIFDFDREQYIADYVSRQECKDENDVLYPYKEGYSYYNDKLKNPLKHYCTRKKK